MTAALLRPAIGQHITVRHDGRDWPAIVSALCGDTCLVRFLGAAPVIAGQDLGWAWLNLCDVSWSTWGR